MRTIRGRSTSCWKAWSWRHEAGRAGAWRLARSLPVAPPPPAHRLRIAISGAVQGVGFRPFVYRLAQDAALAGFVRNTGGGVLIEAEGAAPALARFLDRLAAEAPPHAVVTARQVTRQPPRGARGFTVTPSTAAESCSAVVMADLATCADCRREIGDPADRRFRYPFTTCAACGPRYSVIAALPYDRARTTMRAFPLCPACAGDYADPASRRFHAESICCPACGPRLALWGADGTVLAAGEAALAQAAAALRAGRIVALKGLGGFQLLVDARNEAAVQALRQRKNRPRKPFALMVAGPARGGGARRGVADGARRTGARRPRRSCCCARGPPRRRRWHRRSPPAAPVSGSCCPPRRCTICCCGTWGFPSWRPAATWATRRSSPTNTTRWPASPAWPIFSWCTTGRSPARWMIRWCG